MDIVSTIQSVQLNASHRSFKSNNATTAVIMDIKRHTANDTPDVGNAVRNTTHGNVNMPEKHIACNAEKSMKHGTLSALQEMQRRRGSRRQ